MRVRYRVDGPCRFLPHHDLMRAVQRACRVARVPVCFTQGFSPRPRLAFGPPLPMALGGEREVFDAELERPVEGLEARLNGALPAGIECLEAHLVAARGPSITALVRAADYEVLLPADLMNDALRVRLERFAAAPSFVVAKRRPGKPERQIDLKRGIMELDLRGPRIAFFRLAVAEPGGNETRARTVLEAVLGLDREQAARARVTRLCLRDANGAAL